MINPLPQDRPVFSFYGDDFTGSTDALEALALNRIPAVLFLRTPTAADLCAFRDARAIGIAGESRSRSPEWMRHHLPAVFQRLREIGAPIVQYKVCSTFDSSPHTGSIGCAIDIGAEIFENASVAVVPAAPLLERYVVFGNLFAAANGSIYRIDRHPSMSAHPSTPMQEADLAVHLSRQTSRRIAGLNLPDLRAGVCDCPTAADIVLYDGLDPSDLIDAARNIWETRTAPQTFVAASSGFTYGILDFWRSQGWLEHAPHASMAPLPNQERILVLAGSCSPATEAQIRSALQAGFHGVAIDPASPNASDAVARLAEGRSVVLFTALGPQDRIDIPDPAGFASALGNLLRNVILESGVTRVVIAGGDTASHVAQSLGIAALTFTAPLVRGAPLCRAHGFPADLELVLKGGQIGPPTFFEEVLAWN